MSDMSSVTHDILNCLANLSNDEVFTPPELANKMIDLLPSELFDSTKTTFLDPCCKSGVFLREIAKRLIASKTHKLAFEKENTDALKALSEAERHQKRLDYIYHKQLFGIAITQLTALMSRRTLYCSKYPNTEYSISHFDDIDGNIRFHAIEHTWDKSGKCAYCGASKSNYGQEARGENRETHAYEFIHTNNPEKLWGENMKFDVIIGNPPYQMSDGGGGQGASASPIYHKFIINSIKLKSRYLVMITPSKWFVGGKVPNSFRNQMLSDKHIKEIHDFVHASDCFSGVEIAGGVSFFLRDSNYEGKCHVVTIHNIQNNEQDESDRYLKEEGCDVFIRYSKGVDIINAIKMKNPRDYFNTIVSERNPFGFSTSYRGRLEGDIQLYHSQGKSMVLDKDVKYNVDYINNYKVFVSYANGNAMKKVPYSVISEPFLGRQKTVCTDTYLIVGAKIIHDEAEAYNLISYMKTKFFRFLLSLKKITPVASSDCYSLIPMQDFSKPWTDEELYKKYNLSQEEIDFIESMIKPMA